MLHNASLVTASHPTESSLRLPDISEKSATFPADRIPVMAFVVDAESETSLRGLSDLSLPNVKIIRGDIVRATRHLSVERSPNVLIVDISDVDMPVSRVYELAEVCEPAVTVIAVGNRNDVGLYRDLIHAGIAEYIVKPVTLELLARALVSKPVISEAIRIDQKLGKMIAVFGARGGVGTTTLAVNLAWYLANRYSRRIALVDLDLQNGDCALYLNIKSTPGLQEALANPSRIDRVFLDRAMAVHGERLFVLSFEHSLHEEVEFSAEAVGALLYALRTQFHYVVADIPRLASAPYRLGLNTADRRIIVGDRTLRSVRNIARMRAALDGDDTAYRNLLVINRSGEGGRNEVTLDEISDHTAVRPKIVIPFQPRPFAAAEFRGKVVAARAGRFSEAVASLAAEISGRIPERRPWWRWRA